MQSSKMFFSSALIVLLAVMFTLTECKTASSNVEANPGATFSPTGSNVFVSMAKSLASEALSNFQENARRNPRLGFNITMLLPPSMNLTGNRNNTLIGSSLLENTAQLGVIGLKGGILGIKAAIVQSIVVILFIIFLLSGIAYFACNIGVISCSGIGSGLGGWSGLGGPGPLDSALNPFTRNGYDYPVKLHRTTSAVYSSLEEGQKKYS